MDVIHISCSANKRYPASDLVIIYHIVFFHSRKYSNLIDHTDWPIQETVCAGLLLSRVSALNNSRPLKCSRGPLLVTGYWLLVTGYVTPPRQQRCCSQGVVSTLSRYVCTHTALAAGGKLNITLINVVLRNDCLDQFWCRKRSIVASFQCLFTFIHNSH